MEYHYVDQHLQEAESEMANEQTQHIEHNDCQVLVLHEMVSIETVDSGLRLFDLLLLIGNEVIDTEDPFGEEESRVSSIEEFMFRVFSFVCFIREFPVPHLHCIIA